MWNLHPDEPLAAAAVEAIHSGDVEALRRMLGENKGLATARIGGSRTLLHVATDWPGHFPNGAATVAALRASGAEVNARFTGRHPETPPPRAASSGVGAVPDTPPDACAEI